jgi:hypothetical protein
MQPAVEHDPLHQQKWARWPMGHGGAWRYLVIMTIKAKPLVMVLLAAGCAEAPETQLCSRQQALVIDQGVQLNGVQINGQQINGVNLNAATRNSANLQGRTFNGTNVQGPNLNAPGFQGRTLNAPGFQGRTLNGVNLQGTELRALVDGRPVPAEALVGATIEGVTDDGRAIPLTIAAVNRDPAEPELVYFSLQGPDGRNVCGPDGRGLFVSGLWDATGARRDSADRVTYSCTDGVIAKCVIWGYKPWRVGVDLHQACTRMARADYCGDGVSYTRDGTTIDLYDGQGIQTPATSTADGFAFEAGWGPGGAVCVAHPRYRDVGPDGRARPPSCWSELPRCDSFAQAEDRGALLGNSSVETERLVCE